MDLPNEMPHGLVPVPKLFSIFTNIRLCRLPVLHRHMEQYAATAMNYRIPMA